MYILYCNFTASLKALKSYKLEVNQGLTERVKYRAGGLPAIIYEGNLIYL
jgi:hypothetical protein